MYLVSCDKCKTNLIVSKCINTNKAHGIHTTYIRCHKCNTEYIAYKTNKKIRGLQHRLRKYMANDDPELIEKIETLRAELEKEWNKLNKEAIQ